MTSRIHFDPSVARRFDTRYFVWKRRIDRVFAFPLALLLAPVIGVLWLAVKLTSRGPGFYTQFRLGRHGRPFRIVKLRTMRIDAERGIGAVWSSPNDPRATWVGRALRKSHLDELPQIFNVLRGDMCFVGPRPERPEIAERLAQSVPSYLDRLVVAPGVTGMAQLHLPADKSIECVYKKLGFDFTYIERASLPLDLLVCVATACKTVPWIGDAICNRISASPDFLAAAYRAGAEIQRECSKLAHRPVKPQPLTVEP
jgi:lipopolysaccharide/colanic/teichoic acid biosynthesis glycosyltransferase